jgi:hypothetical protein
MSKSVAEKEVNWFILQWGLTTGQDSSESVFAEEQTIKRKKKQ